MVEFLSSWVKNLSLALIIVSILEIILPSNKTKKYVKMIMGLYILFSIIAPFIENSDILKFDDSIYTDYFSKTTSMPIEVDQTSMDNRLNEIYVKQLEEDIIKKVEENGYKTQNCKVKAQISEKDSGIESIILKISGKKEIKETHEANIVEDKIITDVKEIEKVNIAINEGNNEKEQNVNITKKDIKMIKEILIKEYGVKEECLRIS